MSNGGGVGVTPGRPKPDDFARSVTRMAVAQICENSGLDGSKESALDALTDIAIRYLCDLGKTATFNAVLSGRTQCNFFDIVRGLEDIGSSQGFLGASSSSSCLVGSGMVNEVVQFMDCNEEVPFAQPLPRFPVVRDRKLIPSFEKMEETPPGKHIPGWLPALPDSHTFVHTPVWSERVSDLRAEKIEQVKQRRKAERALLNLQQRLLGDGSAGASTSQVSSRNGDVREVVVVKKNASLASPLELGEDDESVGVLPDKYKDHVSVLEAFAPAIEAVKEVEFGDDGDGKRKLLPEKRPAVNFKIKIGKKLLCDSLDLNLLRKGGGRKKDWLGRDDERDEKKRRAEYILRQSMENPQELTQL